MQYPYRRNLEFISAGTRISINILFLVVCEILNLDLVVVGTHFVDTIQIKFGHKDLRNACEDKGLRKIRVSLA
jgi:hypothetical protein